MEAQEGRVTEFLDIQREEFVKQLESTGAYTKKGMELAFERATTQAVLRMFGGSLEKTEEKA